MRTVDDNTEHDKKNDQFSKPPARGIPLPARGPLPGIPLPARGIPLPGPSAR